jgi:signal transduction histidine kinase/ligand-binding sensor domain-containing protein
LCFRDFAILNGVVPAFALARIRFLGSGRNVRARNHSFRCASRLIPGAAGSTTRFRMVKTVRRSRRIPVLLALLLSLQAAAVHSQVLPFTHFTPEREINPLPSAEVHRVIQDRTGVIWMAIFSSGLARYDGARLDILTTDDGLRDLHLWDILEDPRGYLWITSNAGVVVSDRPVDALVPGDSLKFRTHIGDVGLLDVAIRMNTIAAALDGAVWVGTDTEGLVRYSVEDDEEVRVDSFRFSGEDGQIAPVHSVASRTNGSIWAALGDGRLLVLDSDGHIMHTIEASDGLPASDVNLLYEDPTGRLYGGTADGTVFTVDEAGAFRIREIQEALGSNVSSILRDRKGVLWIGTQGSGLHTRSESGPRLLTRANGLLGESIHHLMEDHEGNVWISQTGGVARLRANHAAFENYTAISYRGETPVLPAAAINAVLSAPESACRFWAATAEAGIACIRHDGTSLYFQEADGLQNNWVNALDRDDDGSVWAGTLRGISRIRVSARGHAISTSIERYGGASILAVRTLRHRTSNMSTATVPVQWFPAFQSVYAHIDGAWLIFREASGLPTAVYQSVELAPDGHLLLGTRDRGVFRSIRPLDVAHLLSRPAVAASLSRSGGETMGREISEVLFEALDLGDELPSPQIEDMQRIGGELWIATPSGIAVVDGNTYRVVEILDRGSGMPADNAVSLAFDEKNGMLWAGTNRGLVAIDTGERRAVRVVTQQDGLVSSEVWFLGSVAVDATGSVLYGTANGLTYYRPSSDIPLTQAPQVLIRKVALLSGTGRSNEVSFEYSALTYADEKRTLYRTRLAGYEDGWSEPSTETRLRYTNLPAILFPRTYALEVIAANMSGVWSEVPASYGFDIRPPWWLSWWAFLAYALTAGIGVVVVHRVQHGRVVRSERQKALLREAELRAETANANIEAAEARERALVAENDRKAVELQKARELERAYYDLKAAQARLVQAEKMASLGRLAGGIAHEIKNPLNFVNNFAALSADLVQELREVMATADGQDVSVIREDLETILSDLELNSAKIREHGKRTDGIVRSMLMHSRGTGSESQTVLINEFVEEYMNLAYHGMRAEHADFNTALARDFAADVPGVSLAPQEIGRVLINLLNNAFYAVHEKQRVTPGYQPEVRVSTAGNDEWVEIRVRDNGPGIPAHVRERIFEPFFTTKPTGAGTGLGLSLSYDIVTQGHGGRLSVESRQGDFTEFTIVLPVTPRMNDHPDTATEPVSDEKPTLP